MNILLLGLTGSKGSLSLVHSVASQRPPSLLNLKWKLKEWTTHGLGRPPKNKAAFTAMHKRKLLELHTVGLNSTLALLLTSCVTFAGYCLSYTLFPSQLSRENSSGTPQAVGSVIQMMQVKSSAQSQAEGSWSWSPLLPGGRGGEGYSWCSLSRTNIPDWGNSASFSAARVVNWRGLKKIPGNRKQRCLNPYRPFILFLGGAGIGWRGCQYLGSLKTAVPKQQ